MLHPDVCLIHFTIQIIIIHKRHPLWPEGLVKGFILSYPFLMAKDRKVNAIKCETVSFRWQCLQGYSYPDDEVYIVYTNAQKNCCPIHVSFAYFENMSKIEIREIRNTHLEIREL